MLPDFLGNFSVCVSERKDSEKRLRSFDVWTTVRRSGQQEVSEPKEVNEPDEV